jgi:hypothetical protein
MRNTPLRPDLPKVEHEFLTGALAAVRSGLDVKSGVTIARDFTPWSLFERMRGFDLAPLCGQAQRLRAAVEHKLALTAHRSILIDEQGSRVSTTRHISMSYCQSRLLQLLRAKRQTYRNATAPILPRQTSVTIRWNSARVTARPPTGRVRAACAPSAASLSRAPPKAVGAPQNSATFRCALVRSVAAL